MEERKRGGKKRGQDKGGDEIRGGRRRKEGGVERGEETGL